MLQYLSKLFIVYSIGNNMEVISQDWLNSEFNNLSLGDARLLKRFHIIMANFVKNAQTNISTCFSKWSEIKGSYRFFDNEKVKPSKILFEHILRTRDRINESNSPILILHDTTFLDYKNRYKTANLDRVFRGKKSEDGSKGLILHNSLAIKSNGIPIGLMHQKFVSRKTILHPERTISKKHEPHIKPVQEKESYRWIEGIDKISNLNLKNKVVHIADREGDFYEFLKYCNDKNNNFIVRASHNRAINKINRREKAKNKLFDYFSALKENFQMEITYQINSDKKYRTANLSVSFKDFSFPPPPSRTINKDGDNLSNINLYGVYVKEINPPKDCKPLNWMLLTNLPVTSKDDAIEKVQWYTKRWSIEVFHKILKSGCSVEKTQLRTKYRLIRYITMKSIVAWKIFWLSRISNENQQENSSTVLTRSEQSILFKRIHKKKLIKEFISVKDAITWAGGDVWFKGTIVTFF